MRLPVAISFALCIALSVAGAIVALNKNFAGESQERRYIEERLAAEAVAAGHSIIFPHGMDESVFRWNLAETFPDVSDLVLLGSSHGQQVSSTFFPGLKFLNLCVAGGMFTDDLISSEILSRRGHRPRIWAIIVDPWLFDAGTDYRTWRARPAELEEIDRELEPSSATRIFVPRVEAERAARKQGIYRLDPLLSRLDEEINRLLSHPMIADRQSFQAPIIREDGSIQRGADPELAPAEAEMLAERQFAEKSDRHRYGTYPQLDPKLSTVFENWISWLQIGGSRVVLVFTPYHPTLIRKLLAQPENKLELIEKKVRDRAKSLGVTVIGSYTPATVGVTAADFFDGDHLRPPGLQKIFATVPLNLLSPQARAESGSSSPKSPRTLSAAFDR